jgi:molybdopterin-containing oxidoreductase family membrane subunit
MLETALKGSKKYWILIGVLFGLHGMGATAFLYQLSKGLTVTGMSRDVSWGIYIAQFTFLVGVAASAVMVVLPYYLHNVKEFGKITILGEFLAVAAVNMCLMFILVDLGKPMRMLNVILHPTPNSILFWDMVVLNGYLFLNIIIGWMVLSAERKEVEPPKWVKPLASTRSPLSYTQAYREGISGSPPSWRPAFWLPHLPPDQRSLFSCVLSSGR